MLVYMGLLNDERMTGGLHSSESLSRDYVICNESRSYKDLVLVERSMTYVCRVLYKSMDNGTPFIVVIVSTKA